MIGTRILLAWSMITLVYNVIKDNNTNGLFNKSISECSQNGPRGELHGANLRSVQLNG